VNGEFQKHRILFRAESSAQLSPVTGNRLQLQQVLVNLIMNAIEAMATKDEPRILSVKCEAKRTRSRHRFRRRYRNGHRTADVDQIFNPLFTTKSDGMGMGLSICRAIIEAHEGQLWVTPNRPHGACISIHPAHESSNVC
jgi:signal transduction histidine kinase